ncbi:AMP-binding protein [Dactylosporangium sp. CS-047395]|uniref:AMP-binding protein n=1 Tax=Dactylosporangium sp. CS-047395 TaxID=3239936 RepID=UPI003D8E0196
MTSRTEPGPTTPRSDQTTGVTGPGARPPVTDDSTGVIGRGARTAASDETTGFIGPGARLIDAVTGTQYTGAQLTAAADLPKHGVVICPMRADAPSVLRYLAARAAGRPVLVCDPAAAGELAARFGGADDIHPDLALMLATSGSTGAPRLVRHSGPAVVAAATAIVKALRIGAEDVAVTSLPLFHTLGLSVLHSHLLAGATVVLEPRGVIDPGFWATVNEHRVTAITGVPHTFELLSRLPWTPVSSPSVRSMSVSGGRLRDDLVRQFNTAVPAFYPMYGQTEAGSRICVLPPEHLPAKVGCVGPPVDGMRLSVTGGGEVVCHGKSIMLGYAETAADLARGDDLGGVLATGDRGRLDADGHLWLSGRLNRIGKAYGVRVDLDAVEHAAAALAPAAALAGDDRILVWCEGLPAARASEVAAHVGRALGIHRTAVRVTAIDRLPRRANGKVNYDALPV